MAPTSRVCADRPAPAGPDGPPPGYLPRDFMIARTGRPANMNGVLLLRAPTGDWNDVCLARPVGSGHLTDPVRRRRRNCRPVRRKPLLRAAAADDDLPGSWPVSAVRRQRG